MLPKFNYTVLLFFVFGANITLLVAQPSLTIDTAKENLKKIVSQFPDSSEMIVRSVIVTGNKKTKDYIALREVSFKAGTKLKSNTLIEVIEEARHNMLNTQLFLEVVPRIAGWEGSYIDIVFDVKERWYFFPAPHFKLVDRNLNQWLVEQNRSLERVNYGIKFNWDNVSGRRDKLNFNFINGYTREYSVFYEQPYADKKLENGFLAGVFYKQSRQLTFATDSNRQVFFPSTNNEIYEFVRTTFKIEAGFTIRKGVNNRHTFRLNYVSEKIPDTVNQIIAANSLKGYLPYFFTCIFSGCVNGLQELFRRYKISTT